MSKHQTQDRPAKAQRLPFTPLYDRVLKQDLFGPHRASDLNELAHVQHHLPQTPRFLCDEAAAWVYEDSARIHPGNVAAPIRLPFPQIWVEWSLGSQVKESIAKAAADGDPDAIRDVAGLRQTRVGAFISEDPVSVINERSMNPRQYDDLIARGATRLLMCSMFMWGITERNGSDFGFWSPDAHMLIFVNDAGQWVGSNYTGGEGWTNPVDDNFIMGTGSAPVIPLIAMMNCRNVRTTEHRRLAPPVKKSKGKGAKKAPGLLSYSTIALPGVTYEPNGLMPTTSGGDTPSSDLALHVVRGHFATFTAEAPRLGRASDGVGTFWISPHVRGNPDQGRVQQTYTVSPSDDQKGRVAS